MNQGRHQNGTIEVPEKLEGVRMDINFVKESLYGDQISLYGEQGNESVRLFEFKNEAGEALCRFSLELK